MSDVKRSIKSKLPNVGTTIFTVMSAMANEEAAVNLSQGFPDFPLDPKLGQYLDEAFSRGYNQYAPMPGSIGLREQIAQKVERLYGIQIDPVHEITITAGATEALFNAFAALISEGDEVILFAPAYDSYDPVIRLLGGVPMYAFLKPPEFSINWDEVERLVSAKTKLIVINSPHNPSGSTMSQVDVFRLREIVGKYDLFVISDEVYEHLIYDDTEHQSVLKDEVLRQRSFAIYSFGKTFHATGWKIGYCLAPVDLTVEFRKVHQFNTFSVNHPGQYALEKYLSDGDHWKELSSFYQRKRDRFALGLKESIFEILPCSGTYFQTVRFSVDVGMGDVELAEYLTKKHKIASIPLSVFYPNGKDYRLLRFCFAKKDETIDRALELIQNIKL